MKVAMMMNWLDVQNTNDRPVTVVMKKFLCEAREAGLVGRILHWNIVEPGGGWNSRTWWRIEHSRRRRLGLVGPENIALVQRQAMAACSL